ncbi:MAG: glycerate kinase [Lentisphaerae bacterium]|nr:glycerate kinase [Lentisphaerota bacterium]
MKIVIAPDSYKGAMRAAKVADTLAKAWLSIRPQDDVVTIPLSDGGEGMADALASACGGEFLTIPTFDALMRQITGKAVVLGSVAVLESAEANGIERINKDELNPMAATTFGVGVMISALLDRGCRELIIGIGGSATVDGGAGMLQALGAVFYDIDGNELPPGAGGVVLRHVAKVDFSKLDPRLAQCRIQVACDVINPLCGVNGSAAVFGPQKGATPDMVNSLDANLHHWAELAGDPGVIPGDGAAGGLGFALRKILNAKLLSGAELVMKYSGFEAALPGASMVITGEGCSDEQTVCGKLCACVAQKAAEYHVPTVLVSGALRGDTSALESLFCGCFSISPGAVSLAEAVAGTERNLLRMGANLARLTVAAGSSPDQTS